MGAIQESETTATQSSQAQFMYSSLNILLPEMDRKSSIKLMIPQPSPFELIRIGGTGDGSYLVPNDLDGIDACFSPGVNNFKNFEDELTNQFGIKCHMCDFSSEPEKFRTPLIDGMQTFQKKWLDIDGSTDSISLREWVNEHSLDSRKDLILQIDIEGAEYRNLLAADSFTLKRFRIIVIELHRLNAFQDPELFSKEVGALLTKLDKTHVSIHAHPNNCCGESLEPETGLNIPNVIEVTYLRRDRFTGEESRYIQPQLPHPLDISRNVSEMPPIHLNEKWLEKSKRSLESELKVLHDNLDFANWERDQLNKDGTSDTNELTELYSLTNINLINILSRESIATDATLAHRRDLALGKKYLLSKAFEPYSVEGIVKVESTFFFHTAIERNQSITIDLAETTKMEYLVIGNRIDACHDRARNLFCIVHNTREFSRKDALLVIATNEFLRPGGPKSVTPLFGKEGRYLSVFSPIHTALHFSSICIY